jgi:hypothetical protein
MTNSRRNWEVTRRKIERMERGGFTPFVARFERQEVNFEPLDKMSREPFRPKDL